MKRSQIKLFLGIAAAFSMVVSSQSDGRTVENIPSQLVGNCIENEGAGHLEVKRYQGDTYYSFICKVPVFSALDFQQSRADFPSISFDELTLKFQWQAITDSRHGFISGYVGQISSESVEPVKTLNLFLHITCGPQNGRRCDRDHFLSKARQLGAVSDVKVDVQANRPGSFGPTSVCIEPGPGYPNGPDCYRSSSVDPVSGSYCKVPQTYPSSGCSEYGNVNPPYPNR